MKFSFTSTAQCHDENRRHNVCFRLVYTTCFRLEVVATKSVSAWSTLPASGSKSSPQRLFPLGFHYLLPARSRRHNVCFCLASTICFLHDVVATRSVSAWPALSAAGSRSSPQRLFPLGLLYLLLARSCCFFRLIIYTISVIHSLAC